MYVKMFKSIFDGSLYGQFEPTVVFMAMLVIAEREGIVDMTPKAIAARCGYPVDIVLTGIRELEKPDPHSRTPDEDGRRIVLLDPPRDWGWRITNYEKYEQIRSAEERRAYFRQKKREQRMSNNVHNVHNVHQCPPPNLNPNPQPKRIQSAIEIASPERPEESPTDRQKSKQTLQSIREKLEAK